MSIEAMKLALEALEDGLDDYWRETDPRAPKAITALRQAIEAYAKTDKTDGVLRKEWVGLDAADWNNINVVKIADPYYVARWAESVLKEKNT
jgi:hypothetical protein